MAEQRHAGAEPGSRRPLGQGLRRRDKTGAPLLRRQPAVIGRWPDLAHRGARSDPAVAGAGDGDRIRGRGAMSGHSERRVNPPVGRPMSGGAGATVGLLKQPA
jgi:hypothetical protein